jgi:hypothetical protein
MAESTPPAGPQSAGEVGGRLAGVIAGVAGARLWVRPPYDALPPIPGRLPAGIEVRDREVHVHVACDRLPLPEITQALARRVTPALLGTRWAQAAVHLHIDHLDEAAFRSREGG